MIDIVFGNSLRNLESHVLEPEMKIGKLKLNLIPIYLGII
jgi:hypothetical protein